MKKCSLLLLLICVVFCCNSCENFDMNKSEKSAISWLPEESYYVGYEIDKDTVKFQYSICFENFSDSDITIYLSARFKNNELEGWIKPESFFVGCDENGNTLYQMINSNQKVNVVFTFFGEYTGGTVYESLSFPEKMIVATK